MKVQRKILICCLISIIFLPILFLSWKSYPGKDKSFPSYNISPKKPDERGMGSTAPEIAKKIILGWNLGNSMEATGGETGWHNAKITKELIDLVKKSGFNAIRIPCAFNQYADTNTAKIQDQWMNRVKEVVQYCIDNEMYVILNIHWDGGWLENNCTLKKQALNNARQKAYWEQIATLLRDYDEHLMFASANEPNVDNAEQMAVLNSYHQTFIDAVRSTGGKNAYRVLIIQGPTTDIQKTGKLMTTLPVDRVKNRIMVEVHYYTPWNFCGLMKEETWGKPFYYWGKGFHSATDAAHNATWGEEATLDSLFLLMKHQFSDKGIPVVIGEYGAVLRNRLAGDILTLHRNSRAYFLKYVTQQSKADGFVPFFWDNGYVAGGAVFDRKNVTIGDRQTLDALISGAQ
jgi:endoglucanase